jgi:hypothetical protein
VKAHASWPVRLVRGFATFWWDFLVGDTPELFVAVLLIVGVISLVSLVGHLNMLAVVLLPMLSVVALGASVLRAWRSSRRG